MSSTTLMETYTRLPVAFVRGEGPWLFDARDQRYLDALAGIAVCGLGHSHPGVQTALARQGSQLLHTSNLYELPLQESLAGRLRKLSGMERAFFCNSGAEANEAAIKIARLHGHGRGVQTPGILVMAAAFHGRTMATLSASGSRKVQAGFEPLLHGFFRAPYNNVEALERIAEDRRDVVAVFFEPILGEGGVVVPDADYLAKVRALCDRHGWLLILDEVQTGNGRTGRFFAYQHSGILPDVVTTAKGLGNGVPIGVCLARGVAAKTLAPGTHGSTFGGNPLACAAAHAVLDALEDERLTERAEHLGQRMRNRLATRLQGLNCVREIRGLGLMIGIELTEPCADLPSKALAAGLLINVTRNNVIRLLPPLILTDEEADLIVDRTADLIRDQDFGTA